MKLAQKVVVTRTSKNEITIVIDGEDFPYAFVVAKTRLKWKDAPTLVLEIPCAHLVWDDGLMDKSPTN